MTAAYKTMPAASGTAELQNCRTAVPQARDGSSAVPQFRSDRLFPMFLKLAGRRCLVVGAGAVGESKIAGLLSSGASLHVVAPQATPRVAEWARAARLSWVARKFRASDLSGVFLVIAATPWAKVNHQVFRQARRRGVLCNVVDDPEHCDFYYPAVVRRGPLQIAVSTHGHSPALAQALRRELEQQFGPEYEAWVEQLGAARKRLMASQVDRRQRRRLLHRLASRRPRRIL